MPQLAIPPIMEYRTAESRTMGDAMLAAIVVSTPDTAALIPAATTTSALSCVLLQTRRTPVRSRYLVVILQPQVRDQLLAL